MTTPCRPLSCGWTKKKNVEMRGDARAMQACDGLVPATEEDFYTEYLDYIISVKTVKSVDEAIDFINVHSTGHSEAIITRDEESARRFCSGWTLRRCM